MNALAIAASSLIAQQTNVAVIADNVANATTPGYAARAAQLVSMNPGVKVAAIVTDVTPGVDLISEFANLMQARTAYSAALKVFSASDRMSRALSESV